MKEIKKVLRFFAIYGLGRTAFKAMGRARLTFPLTFKRYPCPDIVLIGCGQFGFSSIGYFVSRKFGRRFLGCFDLDPVASQRFGQSFKVPDYGGSVEKLLYNPRTKIVYIASNHHFYSDYAVAALEAVRCLCREADCCYA